MALRASVGWQVPSLGDCSRALENSFAAVTALDANDAVGMGRLVGDGALYFLIVDLVVHARYQQQRIGTEILSRLEDLAAQSSAVGTVNLVADGAVEAFYRRVGYEATGSAFLGKSL